jgi:formyltetrahydrofolate-dependent phosphoribosylglycinamide formyltransferase
VSIRLAVFASGGGSNLRALLDWFSTDDAARVTLVVSDRADAGALQHARDARVATSHIAVRGRDDAAVARDMLAALAAHRIDVIALAGYLRLVPAAVIERYRDRILNIHPALLPSFGGRGMYGLGVHAAVLAAGCTVTGATVHRVDERYDEGGIIAQWPVPVLAGDSPETLAARVLRVEHRLYPAVVAQVARALTGGGAQHAHADTGAVFRLMRDIAGLEDELHAVTRS